MKECVTCGATKVVALPAWSALIVHVPAVTKASIPPLVIVQTPVVDDVNDTVKLESDVALNVGVVPKLIVPGFANVIN